MEQEMITVEVALHALFFSFIIAPAFIASLVCVDRFFTKITKGVENEASCKSNK